MAATFSTVGDLVAECRRLLQDEVTPYRYPDDTIYRALNIGLQEGRRLRPELFLTFPTFTVKQYLTTDGAQAIPIDQGYRLAFVYFMVGQIQLADQEDTEDQRAAALLKMFVGKLLSLPA